MKRGRSLLLTEHERSLLLSWLQSPALKKTMAHRARIVLESADGRSVRAIAQKLGVSADTVCLWRRRFQTEGLDGLRSRALPGRPRRIDQRREEAILAAVQSTDRRGARPSVASVARASGVSRATVRRLWEGQVTGQANGQAIGHAIAAEPGDDGPLGRSPPGVEPGTVVGIFLDHPLRLMIRVPPRPKRPRAGVPAASSLQATRRRRRATLLASDQPSAILTALEAFRPERAPESRATELPAFLRRLMCALPSTPPLEIALEPWPSARSPEIVALAGDARARVRWLRCRTRGKWLRTVGVWIAEAPVSQDLAFGSVLGHLTDYFATWSSRRGPFIWTGGLLGLPFQAPRCEPLRSARAAAAPGIKSNDAGASSSAKTTSP